MIHHEDTPSLREVRQGSPAEELPFAEEVFATIGAAIEVHRTLGPGFLEAVYQEAFELELRRAAIPFRSQAPIRVHYKDVLLEKSYFADLVVFDSILVELKAVPLIGRQEIAQILNYLKASSMPLGLLINFGSRGKLEWKRFANTRPASRD